MYIYVHTPAIILNLSQITVVLHAMTQLEHVKENQSSLRKVVTKGGVGTGKQCYVTRTHQCQHCMALTSLTAR